MKIKVFTTGGTIDKIYFDAKSQYEVGESHIQTLLTEMNVGFDYDVEALLRKDSLDMTDEDRAFIFEKVNTAHSDKILITHGTDTMIATGKILKTVTGKTIVLTGAMQPALFRNSDAVFNIGCAIGAVQALKHGVYIVINGMIFDPDEVRKNERLRKFESL